MTENGQVREENKHPAFLREIANPNHIWTFQLVGRRNVTGKVIDFLWDDKAVPITLMIKPRDDLKPVEIPWCNIQTIQFERTDNG